MQVSVKNGKVQDVQGIQVAIGGSYSPEQVDFPTFRVESS
jgi:hypothetical protein